MNTNLKFDALYHDEEPGERMGEWVVVEWDSVNESNGAKIGHTVRKFGYDEMAAKMYANNLNTLEMHKEAK